MHWLNIGDRDRNVDFFFFVFLRTDVQVANGYQMKAPAGQSMHLQHEGKEKTKWMNWKWFIIYTHLFKNKKKERWMIRN